MFAPLPGCFDGPADACRHIVGTAELRRRFGFAIAYGIATGKEIYGTHWAEAPSEMRRMDDHDNAIGLEIGATARTDEEVVRRARAAVDAGMARGGDGADGTPQCLPASRWGEPRGRSMAGRGLPVEWPAEVPSLPGYRFGDAPIGPKVQETEFPGGRAREGKALLPVSARPCASPALPRAGSLPWSSSSGVRLPRRGRSRRWSPPPPGNPRRGRARPAAPRR